MRALLSAQLALDATSLVIIWAASFDAKWIMIVIGLFR